MKPIPRKLLFHTVTLKVCTGVDAWQNPTYTDYTLSKVHLQPMHQTKKTADNTLITFEGLLLHDAHRSTACDFATHKATADAAKGDLKIVFGSKTYTVCSVEPLYDETGAVHHTELLLQ